ncbi:hypothetical protein [Myxococcus sp. CA040A]|uniref:hypothetical protein n=1 Tax=Myxococcus sp. CA040A TaxID=2741738 RepID=UPI00157B17A5|nr:hypothetical protein [Myxococcus sp. CA040A]NTX02421.1 hypothetical protein [Myxococcus sp. CA040A]
MPLALTGLGMVSSVGWGSVTSCAAIRAGLTRPRPVHDIYVTDQDPLEPVPLTGHPILELTDGFGPIGRWSQLAEACVADLWETARLPPVSDVRFWAQTDWIFVLPRLDPARYLEVQDFGPDLMTSSLRERLGQRLRLELPRQAVHFVHAGHAGTAIALQLAQQLLSARHVERFVVLALDSYLDETSLEWLHMHRRLKSPDQHVGLAPGESGACLLVELRQTARQRGVPVLANIEDMSTGNEAGSRVAGRPGTGRCWHEPWNRSFPKHPRGASWAI